MFENVKTTLSHLQTSILYPFKHVFDNLNTGAIDENDLELELRRLKMLNRQVRRQVNIIEQRVRKIAKTKNEIIC